MSTSDIKTAARLSKRHNRRKLGLVLCEGRRCCVEALRQCPDMVRFTIIGERAAESPDIQSIRQLTEQAGGRFHSISDSRFNELAATEHSQGVLCALSRPSNPPPEELSPDPLILILDRLGDPGNLGTILRTAWGVGLREVWTVAGTTDPYGPKAIRAGMGAQFALRIRELADLPEAADLLVRQRVDQVWRAAPGTGTDCWKAPLEKYKCGLVIGNEAHGAGELNHPDLRIDNLTIPMPGTAESLNAAQAATVLLFEFVRRRILSG